MLNVLNNNLDHKRTNKRRVRLHGTTQKLKTKENTFCIQRKDTGIENKNH